MVKEFPLPGEEITVVISDKYLRRCFLLWMLSHLSNVDVCIVRSDSHELIICGGDSEDAFLYITRISWFHMYSNGSYRREY